MRVQPVSRWKLTFSGKEGWLITSEKDYCVTESQVINKIKEDIEILQYRMGGAEYLIKYLTQRIPDNEIAMIKTEIDDSIKTCGRESVVAKILEESLRLLSK